MNRFILRLALLVLLLAMSVPASLAQISGVGPIRQVTPPPSPEPTTVRVYSTVGHSSQGDPSGAVGEEQALVGGLDTGPIYAVEMGERSDQPCYLRIFYWTGEGRTRGAKTFNECNGTPTRRSLVRIGWEDRDIRPSGHVRERERGSSSYGVMGLSVCSNKRRGDGYRVKGLRLYGAVVSDGAAPPQVQSVPLALISDSREPFFERRHCRSWEPDRTCPRDRPVVGLSVHYRTKQGRAEITGLAPLCGTVTYSIEDVESE